MLKKIWEEIEMINFIIYISLFVVMGCSYSPQIIDKEKFDFIAKRSCDKSFPDNKKEYSSCFELFKKFVFEECKKPTTSIKFCSNYGVQAHPDAPFFATDAYGFNNKFEVISYPTKKKIVKRCSDLFKIGTSPYFQCINEEATIFQNECHKQINEIHLKQFKEICEVLNGDKK